MFKMLDKNVICKIVQITSKLLTQEALVMQRNCASTPSVEMCKMLHKCSMDCI